MCSKNVHLLSMGRGGSSVCVFQRQFVHNGKDGTLKITQKQQCDGKWKLYSTNAVMNCFRLACKRSYQYRNHRPFADETITRTLPLNRKFLTRKILTTIPSCIQCLLIGKRTFSSLQLQQAVRLQHIFRQNIIMIKRQMSKPQIYSGKTMILKSECQ